MFLELNSVGCVFSTETKMIYAKYQKGGYDVDSGVELSEITNEFVDSMSDDDVILISENI